MKIEKNDLPAIAVLIAMIVLIAMMFVSLAPLMTQVILNAHDESVIIEYIDAYGPRGIPVLLGLQILQVLIPVIPAALVAVLSGLCYGIWIGALIGLAGTIAGNGTVFILLRQFGRILSPYFEKKQAKDSGKDPGKLLGIENIANMKHPRILAFLLYLIPVIPNGILPYVFAKTKLTFWEFMMSVVSAVAPSLFLCTWLGECLSEGNYLTAAILVAVIVLTGAAILLSKDKIISRLERKGEV